MLFGKSIQFSTSQSREAIVARLKAVISPAAAIAPFKPVLVSDWIAQYKEKRFIGTFDGSHFKLVLLQTPGSAFRLRGNIAVIIGSVEDNALHACIRPPLFILGFLVVFAVLLSAGLTLSFLGSTNLPMVQAAIALTLVMPFATVAWFFCREAANAEQALRQIVLA